MAERPPGPFPDNPAKNFMAEYLYYIEGVIRFYEAECPKDLGTSTRMGWSIGQQIVAQYVVEMLLRIRLEINGISPQHTRTHNLLHLYNKLTNTERTCAEKNYTWLLNSEVEWTWTELKSVSSFLEFLGSNPIKNTRYPWQGNGTLFSPKSYKYLIYALFIGLFDYPVRNKPTRTYNTQFRSLSESLRAGERKN